ncbi:MAG: hypothetical protein AB1405_05185 [Bdellovibrionota bacterium]
MPDPSPEETARYIREFARRLETGRILAFIFFGTAGVAFLATNYFFPHSPFRWLVFLPLAGIWLYVMFRRNSGCPRCHGVTGDEYSDPRFCQNCGLILAFTPEKPPPHVSPQEEARSVEKFAKERRRAKLIALGLALAILASAAVSLWRQALWVTYATASLCLYGVFFKMLPRCPSCKKFVHFSTDSYCRHCFARLK